VIRAIAIRQTHLNRLRHAILSRRKKLKRKRIRRGSRKEKKPGGGRGRGITGERRGGRASAKSSLISLRCLKKMSAEICRAIHLVDNDTLRVSNTRVFPCIYVRETYPASRKIITIITTATQRLMLDPALIITNTLIFLTSAH